MKRLSILIWIAVIVAATLGLYRVKYDVQSIRTQVAETSHQLEAEKESLHVVAAEWAYLNRPERLQKLADKYLGSSDVTVKQVADIQSIPFPDKMEASLSPEDGFTPVSLRINK